MFKNLILTTLLTTFFFAITPKATYAYIDLGSGSYMFQLAIGFLLGSIFTLKVFGKKILDSTKSAISAKKKDAKNKKAPTP